MPAPACARGDLGRQKQARGAGRLSASSLRPPTSQTLLFFTVGNPSSQVLVYLLDLHKTSTESPLPAIIAEVVLYLEAVLPSESLTVQHLPVFCCGPYAWPYMSERTVTELTTLSRAECGECGSTPRSFWPVILRGQNHRIPAGSERGRHLTYASSWPFHPIPSSPGRV